TPGPAETFLVLASAKPRTSAVGRVLRCRPQSGPVLDRPGRRCRQRATDSRDQNAPLSVRGVVALLRPDASDEHRRVPRRAQRGDAGGKLAEWTPTTCQQS